MQNSNISKKDSKQRISKPKLKDKKIQNIILIIIAIILVIILIPILIVIVTYISYTFLENAGKYESSESISDSTTETQSTNTTTSQTTACENQSNYEELKAIALNPTEIISSGPYSGWQKYELPKLNLTINLPKYWVVRDNTRDNIVISLGQNDDENPPIYEILNYSNEGFAIGFIRPYGAGEFVGTLYDDTQENNYTFRILGKDRNCSGVARVRDSKTNECESLEAFHCVIEEILWEKTNECASIVSFSLSNYQLNSNEIRLIFESITMME